MSNPFNAKFDSKCNSCGDRVYEGDEMFCIDSGFNFICSGCAKHGGYVCECGGYKDSKYETCYECKQLENDTQ